MALVALMLGAWTGQALSQEATGTGTADLSWDRPTAFTNGDELNAEDIEHYTVYWGTESRVYTNMMEVGSDSEGSTLEFDLTEPVTMYFAVTATARGLESDYSNEASKVIELEFDESEPNAPTNLEAEIQLTCETDEGGVSCQFVVR